MRDTGWRGKVMTQSTPFYEDQMNFIEDDMVKCGLNFSQYVRKLVDAEMERRVSGGKYDQLMKDPEIIKLVNPSA